MHLSLSLILATALVLACGVAGKPALDEQVHTQATQSGIDCSAAGNGHFDRYCQVKIDSQLRKFWLTLPSSITTAKPVVFLFHGAYSNAEQQASWTSFADKARGEGFILVTPAGSGYAAADGGGFGFWNGGRCCSQADDVLFVTTMLNFVESEYKVDTARIFATGISNGGIMVFRLACDLSERIAAIAPVAAQDLTQNCRPKQPVAVLQIHGTDDALLPYGGGRPELFESLGVFFTFSVGSVTDTVQAWVEHNGCSAVTTTTLVRDEVFCAAHRSCQGGVSVEHCRIDGGGHTWPDWNADIEALGYVTRKLNATDYIWKFFQAHPRR